MLLSAPRKIRNDNGEGVIPKLHRKADHTLAATDSLVFEDVESGVDMEYSVTGSGVKENILDLVKGQTYTGSPSLCIAKVFACGTMKRISVWRF